MANAASGMTVSDDCKVQFGELKAKKAYRWIVFKIDEKAKQVVVEKSGGRSETHADLTGALPEDECRYCVFDFAFTTDENYQKESIFFISWSPDIARDRSKMIYASSKERFLRALDGVLCALEATNPTEMGIDVPRGRVN